jgi:flagellar assembly protein FliH
MTARAKYLFDVDFGGSSVKPVITITDHKAQLAQAEQVSYRSGFAAGEARAAAEAKQSATAALAAASTAFDRLHRDLVALEMRLESEAVDVAVAVAHKLAPELMAREPLAELSALARDCFRDLVGAPHVAIRVSDVLFDKAREALEAIARDRGFEGRLVVLADPAIAPGDCRIEWADGGIVRDRQATDSAMNELVARYLRARQSGSAQQPASESSGGPEHD